MAKKNLVDFNTFQPSLFSTSNKC